MSFSLGELHFVAVSSGFCGRHCVADAVLEPIGLGVRWIEYVNTFGHWYYVDGHILVLRVEWSPLSDRVHVVWI